MSTNRTDAGQYSNVTQLFKPKKIKKRIRREIEGSKKVLRRLARPALIVPKKVGKKCAFSSSCRKECAEPDLIDFGPAAREDLTLALTYLFDEFRHSGLGLGAIGEEEPRPRRKIARELVPILAGAWNPLAQKNYVCGSVNGEHERLMANFSNLEMREVLAHKKALLKEEFNLELNLSGTYMAKAKESDPFGLQPKIAELLARIANLTLPENENALRTLIEEGGLSGIHIISRMVSEPTTPHQVRMKYVDALAEIISCVDFSREGKLEVLNEDLALKLSRFYPKHRREANGQISHQQYMGIPLPEVPFYVSAPRLREIMLYSVGEVFQAVLDLSGRLQEMALSREEGAVVEQETINSLYSAMERSIVLLLKRDMPNKIIWDEFVSAKLEELEGEPLYPGEQTLASNLAFNLPHDVSSLDWQAANQLFELLEFAEDDAYKYLDVLKIDEF